ncbi:MAG TPA: hypothetical protein VF020_20095 [Chthoniobacterales bacterium]
MRRLSSLVLLLYSFLSQGLHGADHKHLSVVDYFVLLPSDTFEGASPSSWLTFLKQPGSGVIDTANGYMSCTGDGAQPEFEVALFRFSDGRPLLAMSTGELEGKNSTYLTLYELGKDNRMHKASRKIFPIDDGDNWQFILPKTGRRIVVRNAKTGKLLEEFQWNGSTFDHKR